MYFFLFFFQAEGGIRDVESSRGLGDVYKRQVFIQPPERCSHFSVTAEPYIIWKIGTRIYTHLHQTDIKCDYKSGNGDRGKAPARLPVRNFFQVDFQKIGAAQDKSDRCEYIKPDGNSLSPSLSGRDEIGNNEYKTSEGSN